MFNSSHDSFVEDLASACRRFTTHQKFDRIETLPSAVQFEQLTDHEELSNYVYVFGQVAPLMEALDPCLPGNFIVNHK